MKIKKFERGICELYEADPEGADYKVFGRIAEGDRRGFLKGAGLAAMGAVVGGAIPFQRNMPAGLIPAALAQSTKDFKLAGKDGLTVLNDRPINAETPAHLLDDDVTPNNRYFVRNNGTVPEMAEKMDATGWTLTVDGLVDNPMTLSLDDLKSKFTPVKLKLQHECGGNGRAAFNPPARGNQWTLGAVGNAEWTGVRYADLLEAVGVKDSVIYTAHYGMDGHLSGDPNKLPISRGVPIAKAMNPYSMIAYEMNGEAIPTLNGFPVRTLCPGWPGSCSQKWLRRIQLRDVVHDGPKMTGKMLFHVTRSPTAPLKPTAFICRPSSLRSLMSLSPSGARSPSWAKQTPTSARARDRSFEVTRIRMRVLLLRNPWQAGRSSRRTLSNRSGPGQCFKLWYRPRFRQAGGGSYRRVGPDHRHCRHNNRPGQRWYRVAGLQDRNCFPAPREL